MYMFSHYFPYADVKRLLGSNPKYERGQCDYVKGLPFFLADGISAKLFNDKGIQD